MVAAPEPTWRRGGPSEADLVAMWPQLREALERMRESQDKNPMPPLLAAAFCRAQVEFPPIKKTKTGNIKSKKGDASSYSYKYADLAEVVETVRPILKAHGLGVTQSDGTEAAGVYCVTTRIIHVSGESWLTDRPLRFAADVHSCQDLGSLFTYLRRYAYCAALGIVAEDDDDGKRAKQAQGKARAERQERQEQPQQETPPDGAPSKEDLARFWAALYQVAEGLGWTKPQAQAWLKGQEPNPDKSTMKKLREVLAALKLKAKASKPQQAATGAASSSSEKPAEAPEDPALRKKIQARWAMLVGDKKMSKEFAWFWAATQFGWVFATDDKTGLTRPSARATPLPQIQLACRVLSEMGSAEVAQLQQEQADAFGLWLEDLQRPVGDDHA